MSYSKRQSTSVALLVAATFFMENLDATVIATALPQMGESFRRSAVDLNVGISAYILALAVFIPISGWIADRFGARRVFASAIGFFTLASLLCGIAQTLEQFIAARVLQGIGGAMMVPVGRLVVLRITEKKDLVRAIAFITWPGLIAPVLGPPLGGLITTYTSWRWIFYLNLPLGLIALILALRMIPTGTETRRAPLDWFGFLLVSGACLTLMFGMEQIGQGHDTLGSNLVWILAGLMLGGLAVWHMRQQEHPLIDLSNLSIQTYRVSLYGGTLFRISINTAPFLLPLMFQLCFGFNAFHAGLILLALFAGNLFMKVFTTPVMRLFGLRRTLIVNGLVCAVTLLLCALLSERWPLPAILLLLFVSGMARSLQFTANNTLAFADVPKPRMSDASTLFSTVFQLSTGIGVAIGALALRASMEWNDHATAQLTDFHTAFIVIGVIGLLSVIDSLGLARNAGDAVTGHQPRHVR
ncbi:MULTISPECIES: DHA2 family efflux MFS transporter permease subunit [Pseudomonas]|uniref:DHA2 family efflux MFS transporter permease subunit n=1 Tax=Pseudomonas luteola TaxID=47886 RepID=A0A2X2C9E0_PSELU|nr:MULTISPECIES: DHA2 family efflux MFS transporter permease subunit [Pseudomonas]ENA36820.1 drug:H+ antiporter-2 (14 Spanner) (DHA2) family drug resistance MFS transporter [Pseudomonas sp. HPB0071]MBF8640170.1 DHA2 family efflux MFS transporter permease subunit [Pseudomonas zeshuii]RRW50503.1 DHA2 family efflux MFS transporter permease subunit [Pseudomonas luteola]SHI36952.1 drug resistance transporter, EmrB/QacA subfamily [Pseudomonas zeshuii]SPZ03944.1 major facilitator transporter [Pseudom